MGPWIICGPWKSITLGNSIMDSNIFGKIHLEWNLGIGPCFSNLSPCEISLGKEIGFKLVFGLMGLEMLKLSPFKY